jgi:hypothetical protein
MPFDIRLPDGRILRNIPDGTTKAQIVAKLGYDPSVRQEPAFDVTAGSAPLDPRAPVDPGLLPMAGDPSLMGVPMTAMEGPGATPTTTMMDRVQSIPGVRFATGAVDAAYGAGQVASEVSERALNAVGIDANADPIQAELQRRRDKIARQGERGLTRARNPLDPVPAMLPEGLAESYQNTDFSGMIGAAAPFAVASPAIGATAPGLLGVAGRVAYAGATGGVAGYFAPQDGEVSLDEAERNALIGGASGALLGGLIEAGLSVREIIQRLGRDRAGQVILDTVEPGKLETVIDELRNSRPAIPGYAPTAEQAAVAADQPNFAALGQSSRQYAPNQALQQADAQRLAQGEQLGRVNVAAAADGGVSPAGVPAPALPVDDVAAVAAREAQEAAFRRSAGASSRGAIAATQADQLAAVSQQQGARLGQSAQELAEAEARAAASREAGLAQLGPQTEATIAARQAAAAAAKKALEEEAAAIPLGMSRAGTETGEALSAAARAEKVRVDTEIITPAYERAFEAAGETPAAIAANSVPKAALPETAAAVRSVLGSNTAALSSETAPQTLKAMATFGMTPEQVAAAAAGEGVPIGQATLRQINDARVAINADYARAKGIVDPAIRGQTLNHLTTIKAALDADLAASSIPQAGKDLYAAAIQLWRQKSLPRFRTGNVSTKLFQTTIRNTPAIAPSGVAPAFLQNEDTAREFVRLYTSADGTVNQEAAAAMRDGVEDAFRLVVSRNEGIDVKAADKWLRKREGALNVLEDAMPGLRARLEGYVDAQRRVTMTTRELNAASRTIPKEAKAEADAAEAAIKAAAAQETTLARVAKKQRDAAIRADAESASAEVRASASERLNVLSVRERRLKAEADEAKRIAALLTFKSEDDMAAKVLANPEVRDQVIQRSGRNARAALAQRAEWDVNNAGDGAKRMAFIDENEEALTALFRADDPATAAQRLAGLRASAQEAIAAETSQTAGRTAEAAMRARVDSARSAIGDVPVEGESLRAYQANRERLTQGFTDEEKASLEALELDIARQNRVIEQASKADPNVSDIDVATRVAGSNGIGDVAGRLWSLTKLILKMSNTAMKRSQAEQLAQIMLDPNMTADALEAAVRLRSSNQAVRQAASTVGRGAAAAAAQQGASQ